MRRSTSAVRPVSSNRSDQLRPTGRGVQRMKDQRRTSTAGLSQGRRPLRQLRRIGPRWLRRTNVKLRIASIPSWAKPVQQGSRTQVSVVGNLGKSLTVQPLLPDRKPDGKTFGRLPPKVCTKLHSSSQGQSHPLPRRLSAPQSQRQYSPQKLPLSERSPRVEERGPAPVDLTAPVQAVQGLLLRRQRHPVLFEER